MNTIPKFSSLGQADLMFENMTNAKMTLDHNFVKVRRRKIQITYSSSDNDKTFRKFQVSPNKMVQELRGQCLSLLGPLLHQKNGRNKMARIKIEKKKSCTSSYHTTIYAGPRSAIGRAPDSKVRDPGFNTRSGNILSFLLPLFQEGQLSVTGESVCIKYWLTA